MCLSIENEELMDIFQMPSPYWLRVKFCITIHKTEKKIVLESRSVVSRFFSLYYSVMEKIVVLSKIRVDGRNSQNR